MSGTSFVHSALVYEGEQEFMGAVLPFLREGFERGDRAIVATDAGKASALRDELAGDAGGVSWSEPSELYVTGPRTINAWKHLVRELDQGVRVRVVGELPWADRSERAMREWARAEAVLGNVLSSAPVTMVCPYDAAALPKRVLDDARRTHRELCCSGSSQDSADFVEAGDFLASLDAGAFSEAAADAQELRFDGREPGLVRRFVGAFAEEAGMGDSRLERLVLAVSEIATNALRYGEPPNLARVWLDRDEVVCEVTDEGRGITDPFAGFARPETAVDGGIGLWLARQICDHMEIRAARPNSVVRLHMAL